VLIKLALLIILTIFWFVSNLSNKSFQPCLQRAFKAEVYSCPTCRAELGKNYKMNINQNLAAALNGLYPGYESGR